MNSLDEQSLLLRQVAGLRRSGLSHDQALALAAGGMQAGEIADQVRYALGSLRAGAAPPPDATPFQRLLANGHTSTACLDQAASAIEARLTAQSSLRTTRYYLSVAVAMPLLVAAYLGWMMRFWPAYQDQMPAVTGVGVDLLAALRFLGVPLALLAIALVLRFTNRLAPGYRQNMQAAGLLDMVATGDDTPAQRLDPLPARYFSIRRTQVGAAQSGRELAAQLSQDGHRSMILFRHLAPLAGAVLAVPMLIGGFALLALPLFGIAAMGAP